MLRDWKSNLEGEICPGSQDLRDHALLPRFTGVGAGGTEGRE